MHHIISATRVERKTNINRPCPKKCGGEMMEPNTDSISECYHLGLVFCLHSLCEPDVWMGDALMQHYRNDQSR